MLNDLIAIVDRI